MTKPKQTAEATREPVQQPAVGALLERGVRPRVLVAGCDFARGDAACVLVLMRALEDSGIEVVQERELSIEARPTLPEGLVWSVPKAEQLTYGPTRKGRGGKVKRW